MTPNQRIGTFKNQTIAVVGDIMLDRYIYGKVDRISPEAPIPIVARQETMIVPGGAGNAAANIAALGGTCLLFGVVGNDSVAADLKQILKQHKLPTDNLVADNRPTTEKIRVLGNHQQIVRIDHETTRPLDERTTKQLCQSLTAAMPTCQAVLVCDYAKGVVSETLMDCLRDLISRYTIPILADVRPEHKGFYHDLTYITPNRKETSGMANTPIHSLEEAKAIGLTLARELRTNMLMTLSEEGMLVIDHTTGEVDHLPTKSQEVVDVSGAGDTVIAAMTLALASGAAPLEAATLANHAASVVVAKLGTATVSPTELLATFKKD